MTTLQKFGWSNFHQNNYNTLHNQDLTVGRVIAIKGFKYYVMHEGGEIETELAGRLLFGTSNEDLPKTGDWVLFRDYETMGYLIDVLPRMNTLSRKTPGKQTERQVLASNIDLALVVQGLDDNFNTMRLERYLVQLAACGIEAAVVLNKTDLITDRSEFVAQVDKLQRGCFVCFCSTVTGDGILQLQDALLQSGKTYVLIGSSGVGKSSLLNALMQTEKQNTAGVSASNSKGRHTTTARELFLLPNGSLMIDTPGMREFGLTMEDTPHQAGLFPVIDAYSNQCKFADCQHLHEAGCAVLAALQAHELDASLYESYLKLIKEQRHYEASALDKKRLGKAGGKMSREANENRKKYKF